MLAKAPSLPADHAILDLEDSVAPQAKVDARSLVVRALTESDWRNKSRAVRINDCTTRWTHGDLAEIVSRAGGDLDCIVLPKVRNPSQVHFVDHLITQLELEQDLVVGRIGLELQVETADGLVNIRSIAEASDRTEALIFGPGDLASDLRMPSLTVGEVEPAYPGDHWHWALFTIVAHARNAGVQPIDGPYARIHDPAGFREVANRSRALGFDGKWVLHPQQIDAANEIYSESQIDFERATDILEAFRDAVVGDDRGAILFGEEMVDEASRKLAETTVAKGTQQGLVYRAVPADVLPPDRKAWRDRNLRSP